MDNRRTKLMFPLLCAASLVLSACSSNESDSKAAEIDAAAPAAAGQAENKVNTPLTREQVATTLELVGTPAYSAADDSLHLIVRVTNNGTALLPAANGAPVGLGLLQLIPDSNAPNGVKRGADLRVALKGDLEPGSAQALEAAVPADFLVGNKLQAELLQDGVAWFGFNWEQPVLIMGPFTRCADGKGLCDENGQAIAAK